MRYFNFILFFIFCLIISGEVLAQEKAILRWMRKKPVIDSIAIHGNKNISTGEIKKRMYSRTWSLLRSIKQDRRMYIQRETHNRDTLEIKYLYLTNGYLAVRVNETFQPMQDSSALIWINIVEGNRFDFGEKILSGTYEQDLTWPLTKLIRRLKRGKPASPIAIQQVVFDMKTELANQGYPYAKVRYKIDTVTQPNIANIDFMIQSDSLVQFGDVLVEGIKNFPEYTATRELKIKTGERYSRKAIIDSQKRLYESGYFTFSQLNQAETNTDRLHPDFVLKVRERKKMFVSLTAGAGQSDFRDLLWNFNLGTGKRDVDFSRFKTSGGAHRINAYAEYSFTIPSIEEIRLFKHLYRLRYTTPWTFGIRMPISLSAEWEPPIESQFQEYTIRKWSFSARTQKWFGNEIFTTAGLEYNNVKLSDFGDIDVIQLKEEEGITVRRNFFATFRLDSRNYIFNPRTGQLTDLSAEYFGGFLGGEENFYKISAAWSTYQPVWPGWTYAVRLKGGYAEAFGQSEVVPSDERFYIGGANTIRGFTENTLGKLDADGNALGSNYTIIFNQEFRWRTLQFLNPLPLVGSIFKTFPQWQSIFMDIGNGFVEIDDIKINQFAFTYGTGFQIMSPAGPIRIDYARSIKTDRYEQVASRWHFTILYAF